jgi:ribulose-phosphate 3-epimerase
MRKITVVPSLMCSNMCHLIDEIRLFEKSPIIDYLHVDVMDGHFVPNMTLGPEFIRHVRDMTEMRIDSHLMVTDPEKWVEPFVSSGANILYVHIEIAWHMDRLLNQIISSGAVPGVAINPATPLDTLEYALELTDVVLLMTVNPGYAGQKLVPYTIDKIARLRQMIEKTGRDIRIMVDGNVNFENIPRMVEAGADILVGGTGCVYIPGTTVTETLPKLEEFLADLKT